MATTARKAVSRTGRAKETAEKGAARPPSAKKPAVRKGTARKVASRSVPATRVAPHNRTARTTSEKRSAGAPVRTVLERGPKGKKVVAFAIDWPGWSRGARTADEALALLESYRGRYRPVAQGAGMVKEFDQAGPLKVIEDRVGTGSTDFWGISFSPSSREQGPMDDRELDRKIRLLRASWSFFDVVAARVSAEMRKGPRGGGRDRDQIIGHTIRVESEDFARKVGVGAREGAALTAKGLVRHREAYVAAMRAYQAGEGKPMRSWTLPFLIRHSAFHVMDHAWEMEDKDLSGNDAASP